MAIPDPLAVLMEEHLRIERVINALVAFAGTARGGVDDRQKLQQFVAFLRRYADTRHHHKEEQILFVELIAAGFSHDQGPIAVMLAEHDLGRSLVATLHAMGLQETPWTADDRVRLREVAASYARLLYAHIQKEDRVLYPMARRHLSPEAMERIARACEQSDRRWDDSGEAASLLAFSDVQPALAAP